MKIDQVNSYEDAVSYITMIPRFSGKNEKKQTDAFYLFLGEPGSEAKIVHIAGTNGKGSVSAFLRSIFMAAGKQTGVFTSPHLVDIRERICIDEEMISKDDFLNIFLLLAQKLDEFSKNQKEAAFYHPSFFEMLFFMAMLYYEKKRPDIIILETGLGGRLDATNSVSRKDICVICEIGMDHMEYLGNTIAEIAYEKAGILKKNVLAVFSKKRQEATAVIEKKAEELLIPTIAVSKEDAALISINDKDIDFSYNSRYYEYVRLNIKGHAVYQIENAALALRTAEYLLEKKELSPSVMKKGIQNMHWEARMEEVMPGVIIDGAHNEDGIYAFLQSVMADTCKGNRSLLFSAVSDKQFVRMTNMLINSSLFQHIYIAQMENERGLQLDSLQNLFKKYDNLHVCSSVEDAFQSMLKDRKENDMVYIAGSLYLAGQIKQYIKESE